MLSAAAMASAGACAAEPPAEIELSIATFGQFGYDNLYPEYEYQHPGIKITPIRTEQGGPYHQELRTELRTGTRLADIQAVEEGHLPEVLTMASQLEDLAKIGPPEVRPDRWLPWKYEAGRAKDGKLVGYGTDSGPLAMCYRRDLLDQAGMPVDDESVRAMFATWDSYFAAGERYVKRTRGKAWFDSAAANFTAMVNQLDVGYFDRQNQPTLATNTALKTSWDKVTDAVAHGESAGLTALADDGNNGLRQSTFATKVCPAWMLGVIENQAGSGVTGRWAVIDAFPEGGGNWGGSYLTVPVKSKHPKEAAELAAWLTAPEQQLTAFKVSGNFPSQVAALESPDLLSQTNAYFGGLVVGEIFVNQARKVGAPQYKGPGDGEIQESVTAPALKAVEQGTAASDAWRQVVDGVRKLVR
ncbi:ABC transporter substrate-binding protein [Amycolatopsis sp. H20-H5]|nr:ABC transporter substrate-binding protein [Amycolatopsis sp. H20-H5]MEC3982221.1 ABC transporter substrate-binding protein [Amycolatopsis sp. H20-H5]